MFRFFAFVLVRVVDVMGLELDLQMCFCILVSWNFAIVLDE